MLPALILRITLSLVIGIVGALAWGTFDSSRKRWRALIMGLVIAIGAFGSLEGLRVIAATPVEVSIQSPPSGTKIRGWETVVSGSVASPNTRVLLLVHPVNSDRWWVQEEPHIFLDDTGEAKWEAMIFLGTEKQGVWEDFEIVAVASQDALWFDMLTNRYYRPGDQVYSLPPLSYSNTLTLFRIDTGS